LADDALSFVVRVAEQQHDRLDALGAAAAGGALAVRQLRELRSQRGMQTAVEATMTVRRWRGAAPGWSSQASVTRARSQISEPSQ
jgi:hypothetical protein